MSTGSRILVIAGLVCAILTSLSGEVLGMSDLRLLELSVVLVAIGVLIG